MPYMSALPTLFGKGSYGENEMSWRAVFCFLYLGIGSRLLCVPAINQMSIFSSFTDKLVMCALFND